MELQTLWQHLETWLAEFVLAMLLFVVPLVVQAILAYAKAHTKNIIVKAAIGWAQQYANKNGQQKADAALAYAIAHMPWGIKVTQDEIKAEYKLLTEFATKPEPEAPR